MGPPTPDPRISIRPTLTLCVLDPCTSSKKRFEILSEKGDVAMATVAFLGGVGRLAYRNRFLSENSVTPTPHKVGLVKSKIDFDKRFAQKKFLAPTLKHQ